MAITRKDVEYVAGLARLELSEEEMTMYEKELLDVLGFIDKLNELDTEGVEPMVYALPGGNVLRSDELKESMDVEDVLFNAPEREDDYFRVPKIL